MVVHRISGSWSSPAIRQQPVSLVKPDFHTTAMRAMSVASDVTFSPELTCKGIPSNGLGKDQQTLVEWKNTFNMRQVTLTNLASSQLGVRSSCRAHLPSGRFRGHCTSPTKSLDLLRQNIQAAINKEIDSIIKKYLEKFFQPAVDNIRSNLGSSSVTEEHIREVCKQILEEAKQMYCTSPQSRGSSPYSDSETGSLGDYRFGRPSSKSPLFRKRKESDTDSEASQSARRKRTKPRVPVSGQASPAKQPRGDLTRRKDVKWNASRILKDTLFVLGARANKVLGFGQTRGRLYTKHPWLLKYLGDQEDKEWLSRNNLMPSGGKAYLMLLEEIRELAETEEYRNPNLLLHELKGFEVPEFMLCKIRNFVCNSHFDGNDSKKFSSCDLTYSSEMTSSQLSMAIDCMSSTMTPPATVLDSGPPTPSEALELLECPSVGTLASQQSDSCPYAALPEVSPGSHHHPHHPHHRHSDSSLSILLAGHSASDNSQEGE
ncbi:uncharacterized protein LOC134530758 isoform X2 [Bacillus rossius redtenbacheri]|uniref:uncharacterized protein LOC134530758 isoform X2 n=1 Tax=Bacillus rossius redtenbacheri TaxID=93214 RepID=UPI002FDCD1D3